MKRLMSLWICLFFVGGCYSSERPLDSADGDGDADSDVDGDSDGDGDADGDGDGDGDVECATAEDCAVAYRTECCTCSEVIPVSDATYPEWCLSDDDQCPWQCTEPVFCESCPPLPEAACVEGQCVPRSGCSTDDECAVAQECLCDCLVAVSVTDFTDPCIVPADAPLDACDSCEEAGNCYLEACPEPPDHIFCSFDEGICMGEPFPEAS